MIIGEEENFAEKQLVIGGNDSMPGYVRGVQTPRYKSCDLKKCPKMTTQQC